MAVPKLTTVQAKEYQMLYNWDINFTNLTTKIGTNNGATADKITQMFYQCETMDLPSRTFQMAEGNFRGVKIKQAGIPDFGGNTLTMVFAEDVDSTVMTIINAWANLGSNVSYTAFTSTEADQWLSSAGPSAYKCDLTLSRLKSDRKTVAYSIVLVGCQYEGHDPGGGFDGQSSEFVKPSLTVSFDAWYPENIASV